MAKAGTGQPTLFLVGDSHARNYLMTARQSFPAHHVVYLTMGYGCAFLPNALISAELTRDFNCSSFAKDIREHLIKVATSGDVVLVGQALGEERRSSPVYLNFIGDFATELSVAGVPVVLLDSTSPPPSNPELCYPAPWRPFELKGCSVTLTEVQQRYAPFDTQAKALASAKPNLFYVPLRDGLCVGELCGQKLVSGTSIWHDNGGHITDQAAAELSPLMAQRLQTQGFAQRFAWVPIKGIEGS